MATASKGVLVKSLNGGDVGGGDGSRITKVGSIFCLSLTGKSMAGDSSTGSDATLIVFPGTTLTINTVVLQRPTVSLSECALEYGETHKDYITLCPLSKERPIVTGLEVSCTGPKEFYLSAAGIGRINVFGSVSQSEYHDEGVTPPVVVAAQENAKNITKAVVRVEESMEQDDETKVAEPSSKKRKLVKKGDAKEGSTKEASKKQDEPTKEEEKKTEDEPKQQGEVPEQLSKTQRKRLAKQKAKELEEAVAIINKHAPARKQDIADDSAKRRPVQSITKERRMKGGVLVRDIVLGTGPVVKAGRKVSILYEGSFPDGKIFDKNKSKANPLVFRQGTAQVVRGLEIGMEGMKVGGEREITIPPELGYGAKGSGAVIPPHATLIFSVQFIAIGG